MKIKTVESTRFFNTILAVLLLIGGFNWGLIGLFHFDLIAAISGRMEFGETNLFSRLIYILIGVAAGVVVYQGLTIKGIKQFWNKASQEGSDVPAPRRRRSWINIPWNLPPQEESKPKT